MTKNLPDIWQEIEQKTRLFDGLNLRQNLDYEKFTIYSIITHSTAIEGSILTEQEAELLFESGLTAKGKPLAHHLMNTDLKNAYMFAVERAKKKPKFSSGFLKTLNALVMKSTGGINSAMGGNFDSSRGDFRLCGVTAGIGGKSYINYLKIPDKINEFCGKLNKQLNVKSKETLSNCLCGMKRKAHGAQEPRHIERYVEVTSAAQRSDSPAQAINQSFPDNLKELYEITFNAHLDLATIHPWVDGNGRTGRLLMNFLQFYFKLVPTKTFSEDRAEYIESLRKSQDKNDNSYFLEFMAFQHLKTLCAEIAS